MLKKFFSSLNLKKQCDEFKVPLLQCPIFLFIVMGFVVVIAILGTYFAAKNYNIEPELQALAALVVATITFIIGHIIVQGFYKIAEVSRLKSKFIDIISHQMLTPLSSLKWSISLLLSEGSIYSKEEKEEFLGIIKQSNDSMINIVNSLLDVSRIDAGRVKLNIQEIDLGDLAKDVVNSRAKDIDIKGAKIELDIKENLPSVGADPNRMKVVIGNLLDNAIKYSKPGTSIILDIHRNSNRVFFAIEDFGVGISQEERKNIFRKFFRSDKSIIGLQTKGFGLGLFVAKFIIEATGGKIDFESKEGVGSKFWFYLPVYKGHNK